MGGKHFASTACVSCLFFFIKLESTKTCIASQKRGVFHTSGEEDLAAPAEELSQENLTSPWLCRIKACFS